MDELVMFTAEMSYQYPYRFDGYSIFNPPYMKYALIMFLYSREFADDL